MKKFILLLFAAATGSVHAQQKTVTLPGQHYTKTESFFTRPDELSNIHDEFEFSLPKGNRLILQFNKRNQVDSLPDLDSLLTTAFADIRALNDSLPDGLASYRVDAVYINSSKRFRFMRYPQQGSAFSIRGNDTVQMKLEQDTIHLRLYTFDVPSSSYTRTMKSYIPMDITLLLNNIADVEEIVNSGLLGPAISLLRNDLAAYRAKKNIIQQSLRGYYGTQPLMKMSLTNRDGGAAEKQKRIEFSLPVSEPYVQLGFQYIRGAWAPSLGTGVQLIKRRDENDILYFRLMWEPYFFFEKGQDVSLYRNDFITFRFYENSVFKGIKKEIHFKQTGSFGYLIRRKGEYFEPVTFKFALPGVVMDKLVLEPEFVFNKFFRNFSPSLKLNLVFE